MEKENFKIALVELPATLNGHLAIADDPYIKTIYEEAFLRSPEKEKFADDIYSLLKLPPRAIPQLESILKNSGFLGTFSVCPEFNSQKGYLTREEFDRLLSADIVGISSITRTIPQSYELAALLKKVNPDIIIVFGGPHPSTLPEESLIYGDIVVRNEGDITILGLMECLLKNGMHSDLQNILGISYKLNNSIFHNPDRPFLTREQLSKLPFPEYSEDVLNNITNMNITISRGCPYRCEFCSVIKLFGPKYRFPEEDYTLNLIKHHISLKEVRSIFFSDDNIAGDIKRTKRILQRIIKEKIPLPDWSCQIRVDAAFDDELMSLMQESGCDYVCVGFESINHETLQSYNK
ncbi:MAG: radical SAM protein, partial [Thermodesulfobacteriota bacterium]|nr:radical SAM protein [Thermodesulfobacteriota bacterium]